MTRRALVLVVLVVLSGCANVQFDVPDGPETTTPGGTTGTETRPDGVADRESPWGDEPVTVAIETPGDSSRDFTDEVRQALDYWERNDERYVGYEVRYDLAPDAEDPDVVVTFVEEVTRCPRTEHAAGCAPYITDSRQISRPVRVEVDDGFSSDSTVHVLKHELGHTLGLNHASEPQSVMAAEAPLAVQPTPNATERDLPWADSHLTVYLGETDRDRDEVRTQVRHALDYYADGAEGTVPSNLTFSFTDDRAAADVVVGFPDELPCQPGASGSCGSVRGVDYDRDGALEEYDRLEITLSGVDTDAVGWYVGYWLGHGMGLDESELAPPLRDASEAEKESEWWT